MATERASPRSSSLPPPDRGVLEAVLATALPSASSATRANLAGRAQLRSMRRDDVLQRQGDAESMLIIIDGHVALVRLTDDGREVVARVIRKGIAAGIAAMVVGRSMTLQSFALSDGAYASWPAVDMRQAIAADPGLALDFLRQASQGVLEMSERLDTLHYQDAGRRVARALYEYRELLFSEPPVILPHRLPALVGTSREMVSRAVRRLAAHGAIERSRGGLRLVDVALLQEVAGVATEKPAESARGTSSSSWASGPVRLSRVSVDGRARRRPRN